jgi:hypothetical protein
VRGEDLQSGDRPGEQTFDFGALNRPMRWVVMARKAPDHIAKTTSPTMQAEHLAGIGQLCKNCCQGLEHRVLPASLRAFVHWRGQNGRAAAHAT